MNENKFKNILIGILLVVVIIMGLVISDMVRTTTIPALNKFKEDSLTVELLKSQVIIERLHREICLKDSLLQLRVSTEENNIIEKHEEIIHYILTLSPDSSVRFLSGWISKDINN